MAASCVLGQALGPSKALCLACCPVLKTDCRLQQFSIVLFLPSRLLRLHFQHSPTHSSSLSRKKPVTLSVRVSCPDVMFFGALFGTESHKSLRDTRVGRGTDLACAIRRRRRLARGRQWQSSIQHSPERGFLCQFQCHLISAACTFRLCQLFSIHPC